METLNSIDNIRKIVIITDCTDIAYNELHQTLVKQLAMLGITSGYVIDPLVSVKNFSLINAAFCIRVLADIYSAGTVFLVVVNGVNSNPDRVFLQLKNGIILVGNNSGYLNWTIEEIGLEWIYKNKIDRIKNSKSFGGKFVQAPTVARILSATTLAELAEIGDTKDIDFLSDYKIPIGSIVHCDNFGLIKIKSPPLENLEENQEFKIYVNGNYKLKARYSSKMKTLSDGTWVLFPGSSLNLLPELGKVRSNNSALELGVQEGDIISWEHI